MDTLWQSERYVQIATMRGQSPLTILPLVAIARQKIYPRARRNRITNEESIFAMASTYRVRICA